MAAKVKAKPKPTAAKTKSRPITVKTKSKPIAPSAEPEPLPEAWNLPPATKEECLQRIVTLAHRMESYVRFMKRIDNVPGTSLEARQRTLTVFYERLLMFDRELGRIQEELQLG